MKKTKLTIGPKILIGIIVVGIVWAAAHELRERRRVDRLASLPPCRLAAEYVSWRLAFEEQQPLAGRTESAAEEFIHESEIFEQAIRRARDESESRVLAELESVTAIDSARWIHEPSNMDPFVQVMLAECPDEVEEILGRANR